MSNYKLYNVARIRLDIAKSWRLNQHPNPKGGTHETPFRRMCLRCRSLDRWSDRRATIFKGVLPFIITDLIRLVILIAFPIIALWLPSHM
jgi:hypothetical protein